MQETVTPRINATVVGRHLPAIAADGVAEGHPGNGHGALMEKSGDWTTPWSGELDQGRKSYDSGGGWEWFRVTYPNVRDMDAACRAWISVVEDQATEEAIRAALGAEGAWPNSAEWKRGVLNDATSWLLQRLWKGRPAPR